MTTHENRFAGSIAMAACRVQCSVEGHAEPKRNDILSGVRIERWQCSRCGAEVPSPEPESEEQR